MKRTLTALAMACLVVALAAPARAESFDMSKAPEIKRGIQWRAQRSEISLQIGPTVEDPYFRNLFFSLGYNYHINNWLAFGLNAGYTLPVKTKLAKQIEAERTSPGNSFAIPATYFGFVGDLHMEVVPVFGKSMVANAGIMAYDFHLLLGAGFMQVLWNEDVKDRIKVDPMDFAIAPMFGGGVRLFINRMFALTVDCKDYVALMHTHGTTDYDVPKKRWEHNVAVLVGFSVFLPTEAGYDEE
ncbi:MAG: outer membrane beta-barrel domain-containing protein [Deltaproteobacteria bacterium]|nr:outer membrane beta-barrel domain-containing protein [Deltaproteobacteria bacterium]